MEKRDYLFDNLKGLLIILVVFGHLIEGFLSKDLELIKYVYIAIYLFHMPVFIFISGYFSKRNNPRKVLELMFVYMLWQMVLFPILVSILTDTSFISNHKSIFYPVWTYWYLLSLIIWKMITPYFEKIRHNFVISLVSGILIGYSSLDSNLTVLSIGRVVAFYPFFLLGYYCKREYLHYLRDNINKYIGLIIFVLVLSVGVVFLNKMECFLHQDNLFKNILYLKDSYDVYLVNETIGALIRIVLYILQILMILLMFSFISSKEGMLSKIGQNTLFIYLTHGIVIKCLRKIFIKEAIITNPICILICCVIAAIMYCFILSLSPIKKLGKKLTSINMDRVLITNESNHIGFGQRDLKENVS